MKMPVMNPLNFMNEQLEFGLRESGNWFQSTIDRCYREFIAKKEAFIREKLIEKGFEHLTVGVEKKRFPKVMSIKKGEWEYWYADNDTDEGFFVVAIREHSVAIDESTESHQVKLSFQWQDQFPIIN